jgi:hypothetical protein
MYRKPLDLLISFSSVLIVISLACSTSQATPAPTNTLEPAATETANPTATQTSRPSPTPRPTQTPNIAGTQRVEELNAEVQGYFDKGYVSTTEGTFLELDDFGYEWARLGVYKTFLVQDSVGDFFMSAHFKWDSAFKNSNISGCGFVFGIQENEDHYAVFLDRQKVLFLITDSQAGFSKPVGPTRGTGTVKFDYPAEADFTLIVKGAYAYVLVNGEVSAEYTLAQSRSPKGGVGLTVLSGTNKDYGTRCEMTNLHLWLPNE